MDISDKENTENNGDSDVIEVDFLEEFGAEEVEKNKEGREGKKDNEKGRDKLREHIIEVEPEIIDVAGVKGDGLKN